MAITKIKHAETKTKTHSPTTAAGAPHNMPARGTDVFYDLITQHSAILYARYVPLFTRHTHTQSECLSCAQLSLVVEIQP